MGRLFYFMGEVLYEEAFRSFVVWFELHKCLGYNGLIYTRVKLQTQNMKFHYDPLNNL